jgi:hypothetical protein
MAMKKRGGKKGGKCRVLSAFSFYRSDLRDYRYKWSSPAAADRRTVRPPLSPLDPTILMSGITVCTFELPTTGSLSFADHFSNGLDVYTARVSDATQARANLRAVLKESKHTDGDKDYLRLVKARLISDLQQNGHSYPASASRR